MKQVIEHADERSRIGLFFYRAEVWKTTIGFRVLLSALVVTAFIATRSWWAPAVSWTLVCPDDVARSDVILIENLEHDYLLFERAAELQQQGYGSRVLVLVQASDVASRRLERVPAGFAAVMVDVARLKDPELIPFKETEPITMSVAYQVRDTLKQSGARSVLVVSGGFRSWRTHLSYSKALEPLGIEVHCAPVWGTKRPDNWTQTWHGIQEVLLQVAKLQYYRARVL